MLAPENDTTIGLTVAGALTPAGLGGCVIELMDRGLIDFMISTGANLYHDLHYALNFSLHRGSPFLDDVELYEQGIIRIYDVLFPATVLLETDSYIRDFLVRSKLSGPDVHLRVPLSPRPRSAGAESRVRRVLGRRQGRRVRRADLHLVARRQLDRHEHRLPRADERQHADDRSEPRRQRGLRDHPRRPPERLRHPRRRLAEELLPAGAADALGGLRDPQGRQRLLHPDHHRPGGLGRPLRGDARRGGQLGQGQSRRAARHRRRLLRFDDRLSALLRVRRRLRAQPARAPRTRAQARRAGGGPAETGEVRQGYEGDEGRRSRRSRRRSIATADGHLVVRARAVRRADRRTSPASMPTPTCRAAWSATCARSSGGTCCS